MDNDVDEEIKALSAKFEKELKKQQKKEKEFETIIKRILIDNKKLKSRIISLESENMSVKQEVNSTNRRIESNKTRIGALERVLNR